MIRQFTKTEGVVERKVRNSLILVPLKTGPARLDALYTLNDTAAFIWRELGDRASEDDLVSSVVAEYEVDEATARRDVSRALNSLLTIGALQVSNQEV